MKPYATRGEIILVNVKEGLIIPAYVVDVQKHKRVNPSESTVTYILYAQNRLFKTYCKPFEYEQPVCVEILSEYAIITNADRKMERWNQLCEKQEED